MDGDNKIIAARLEQIRRENGLTLDAMGEIMGVSGATISRYISGDVQLDNVSIRRYINLAKHFGLNPPWVMDLSDKQFKYGKV